MMKLPRLVTYTLILAFLVLLFLILKTLRFYFVPASFAALLAMLMLPFNRKLEQWKVPRVGAILISLFVILLIVFIIGWLFTAQIVSFANDLPTIKQQLSEKFDRLQSFIAAQFGYGVERQTEFLNKELTTLVDSADKWAASFLVTTGGTLAGFGILILHYFLFLLYRKRIKSFFMQMLPDQSQDKAEDIISQIAKVTQQYLTGVITVMAILSVLGSIGFLALGIRNAIFFGVLAAVLNVIPYIGVWIGGSLPVIMALITKDSIWIPVGAVGVIIFCQFLDNNFLTPGITGSQVKINALATIGIIIIGNMVWGVAGMILFIPLLGMAKIIFDNVETLKPLGYLIGDDSEPGESKIAEAVKRIRGKKKK